MTAHSLADEYPPDPRPHHLHDSYERAQPRPSNIVNGATYRRSRYPPLPKLRRAAVRPEDIRNCANNPIPYHQRNNLDAFVDHGENFPLDDPALHVSRGDEGAGPYLQSFVPGELSINLLFIQST